MRSQAKITCINPAHVKNGPEVKGEAVQYIFIWQPAIPVVSPVSSPAVADQEGTPGFTFASEIRDPAIIIIAYRHYSMTPLCILTLAGIRDVSRLVRVLK